MFKIIKIIFLTTLFSYAAIGQADVYEVMNVEKGDTLNLRAKPDPNAERVAVKIPHDAKDVLFLGEQKKHKTAVWYKIRFNEADGWVNSRYLRERKLEKPELLDKLNCFGAEPHWVLKRNKNTMKFHMYSDPDKSFIVKSIKTSMNYTNEWKIDAKNNKDKTILDVAITETNQCNDSMSDYIYRYVVRVRVGENYLTGCCTRIGGVESK